MTTIVVPAVPGGAQSGDQTWLKFLHENSREIASFSRDIARHCDLAPMPHPHKGGTRIKRTSGIGPLYMYAHMNGRTVVGWRPEQRRVGHPCVEHPAKFMHTTEQLSASKYT